MVLEMARVDPSIRVDPEWLLEERPELVCSFCLMVMEQATSGCKRGHLLCRGCWPELWRLQEGSDCPGDSGIGPQVGVRMLPVRIRCPEETNTLTLQPAPVVDTTINRLRVRCKNASIREASSQDGDEPAAKRVKLASADSFSVPDLRRALSERGLDIRGGKVVLVARLETDRRACGWIGTVSQLRTHLEDDCACEPMRCPNGGCEEWGFRGEVAQHADSSCPLRRIKSNPKP